MPGWRLCFALCALGCGAAPSARPLPPPAAANSPPAAAAAPRLPSALQKTFTGQPQPSLVVKNGFPVAQHLFIDWVEQALLAPASSQSFQLTAGTHTVTCADSADPDDHPAAISEAFDAGYSYFYELRAGG